MTRDWRLVFFWRVGLSVGALIYWIVVGHGHTWAFAALMIAAIWRSL